MDATNGTGTPGGVSLPGVIDMHVHTAPDIAPRRTDDLGMAKAAAAAGMGGFVIKSHLGSSVERALLTQAAEPRLRVCGGIVLNFPIGGINPFAVEAYVRLGAKEVWMPTLSAEYMLQYQRENVPLEERISFNKAHGGAFVPPSLQMGPGDPWPWSNKGRGISILDDRGRLVPEVRTVLEIIAPTEVILGTAHLSVPETHTLVEEARAMGVKRILITHPEYMAPLSLADQRQLARKGVFFERCFVGTTPVTKAVGGNFPFDVISRNIREIGVDSTVLGTDFGQEANVHPVAAMAEYLRSLSLSGFSDREIEVMSVINPRALLGI